MRLPIDRDSKLALRITMTILSHIGQNNNHYNIKGMINHIPYFIILIHIKTTIYHTPIIYKTERATNWSPALGVYEEFFI